MADEVKWIREAYWQRSSVG